MLGNQVLPNSYAAETLGQLEFDGLPEVSGTMPDGPASFSAFPGLPRTAGNATPHHAKCGRTYFERLLTTPPNLYEAFFALLVAQRQSDSLALLA